MASSKLYGPSPASALPAPLAIAAATETFVPNPVTAPNPLLPGVLLLPLLAIIPSGSILEKRVFELLFAGTITTGAASTVTAKIYGVPSAIIIAGTSGTLGNDVALSTSGAITQNTTTAPFVVKGTNMIYDSTSGKMTGKIESQINGVLTAAAAFVTAVTGISNGNDPVYGFLMTLALSGALGSAIVNQADINY